MVRLRAPTLDDLEAVYAVIRARDVADLGVADYHLADLRDEWAESAFDLAADARVALDAGGAVVGYGDLRGQGAQVYVHPEHDDPRALVALEDFVEQRARAEGRDELRQLLASGNVAGREELERRGYAIARHYWRLGCTLEAVGAPPAPPSGLVLRPIDPAADAAGLWRLDDDAFRGAPDFHAHTETAFREEHLATHDFAPELSLVSEPEAGGAPVGYLVARRFESERTGFIDLLGVHPDARGAGLGSALLRTALAGFAAAGLERGDLTVATDNPRALGLYERAGLEQRWRFDAYHRPAAG